MARYVHVHHQITGEPKRLRDALITQAPELLQIASGSEVTPPAGDGSFTMVLQDHELGVDVHKAVRVTLGEAITQENWLRIPIRWEADPGKHLFPTFDGGLEIESLSMNRADLVITGRYRPPLGAAGALANPMLGPGARRVVATLTHRLARTLINAVYGDEPLPMPEAPAGQITVEEVMSTDLLTLPEDMSLRSAAHLMLLGGISGAPVVADGRVVGVLSERDLLHKAAETPHGFGRAVSKAMAQQRAVSVGQACSRPALMTEVDTTVRDAATEMTRHDVARLVVMRGAEVVGLVTRTDILRALIRPDEEIAMALSAVLDPLEGEDIDLRWDVEMGMVTLHGTVARRSQAAEASQRAADVIGVIAVDDDDLSWEFDDVIPPPMM